MKILMELFLCRKLLGILIQIYCPKKELFAKASLSGIVSLKISRFEKAAT